MSIHHHILPTPPKKKRKKKKKKKTAKIRYMPEWRDPNKKKKPKIKDTEKVTLSFRLSYGIVKQIDKVITVLNISKSQLIRAAIEKILVEEAQLIEEDMLKIQTRKKTLPSSGV